MQPRQFSYDELTPLEQCILDFIARQSREHNSEARKKPARKATA
jgi:hypothetical protein